MKMNLEAGGLIAFVVLAGFGSISIAELPKEVSTRVFEYEVLEEELQGPFQKLDLQYLKRLAEVKKVRQESGDLEGMLSAQKEIDAMEAGTAETFSVEGPVPAELKAARDIYNSTKIRLLENLRKERARLRNELVVSLRGIQTRLTQEGKLEEAVEVRAYADELVNEIAADANALSSVPAANPIAPRTPSGNSVNFKMQVDGSTHIFIKGDQVWYDHTKGKAKAIGLHEGEFPTYINGNEWMPVWSDKVTVKHDAGIGLPGSGNAPELSVVPVEGRGHAIIEEHPTAQNDYTAKLAIHDASPEMKRFGGSKWLQIKLTW